jgi:hypothetical protein
MTTHNAQLNAEERYELFLSSVSDSREIWILVNGNKEFLKIYSQEDEREYVPLWPDHDAAQVYASEKATTDAEALQPKVLSLPEFYQRWVPGLTGDEIDVGVYPGNDGYVWQCSAQELKQDLDDVMSQLF